MKSWSLPGKSCRLAGLDMAVNCEAHISDNQNSNARLNSALFPLNPSYMERHFMTCSKNDRPQTTNKENYYIVS